MLFFVLIICSVVVSAAFSMIAVTGISMTVVTVNFATRKNPSVTRYKTAITRDKHDND